MVRVISADITSREGDFERLACKIVQSAFQQSRPSNKPTTVSIPPSILTGVLRWEKQLPIIVLELDGKFTAS